MSESVPLGPALRVQLVCIVVGYVLKQGLDIVFEGLAREERCLWMVQWETDSTVLAYSWHERRVSVLDRHHLAGLDLAGGCRLYSCRREEVEAANLQRNQSPSLSSTLGANHVILAPHP